MQWVGISSEDIPVKEKIVTLQSTSWLKKGKCDPIILSTDICDFPEPYQPYTEQLEGRAILVRKMTALTVKCVAVT